MATTSQPYRGRLAPSPTGLLHLGHARTFAMAAERARGGEFLLRIEDLDQMRCKPEFEAAVYEDLRWLGLSWSEGPDVDGPFAPYRQSERRAWYLAAWEKLRAGGFIYPCFCSRKDVQQAVTAPHGDDEPVYPGTCRPAVGTISDDQAPGGKTWRFRVPDGERLRFHDEYAGEQQTVAGVDFGDFVIWRRDDVPAYQLAVVADDAAMGITEVVRGDDLRVSTFRQLLLYRALGLTPPRFYHCPLVLDASGRRLAKREDALSLRTLRERGITPEQIRNGDFGADF
ncbi:MAG: tRNA glutamyl-Q(34) synthetase GluQRS [Chthoniobacteraceae bacterium]